MSVRFTNAVNNARSTAITTATGNAATLKIYSGSAPANSDTAVTGNLLVTLTCGTPFGSSTTGVLTLGAVTSATAVFDGTAGYARLATSGGTAICDFTSISTTGADLNLNSVTISSGGTVAVTSGTITEIYP